MTEHEILEMIWKATITPETWVKRIRANPDYKWQNTMYGKALLAARAMGSAGPTPTPTPTPTPNPLAHTLQNVIYCAQSPLSALAAPKWMKPVLTADPGYASFVSPDVVAQLKAHFGSCGAWGVQTQIGVDRMRWFQSQYNLDFLIFQGETSDEYRTAIEANAALMVGNANSWTQPQREDATHRINAGTLAFAQEAYTNLGNPWPDQTSAGGVPACCFVLGVYDGSAEVPGKGWNPSLADYKAHTSEAAWHTISIYHAAGVRDWGSL